MSSLEFNLADNKTSTKPSYNIVNRGSDKYSTAWNSDWMKTVRISLYVSIIVVAFFGNGLLVLTMVLTKRMRTITNYFLLNMAVGDLSVSLICMPLALIRWFDKSVFLDISVCKSMPFLQGTAVGISIYTLVVIATDRYLTILNPLARRMKKKYCFVAICFIWVCAMITASPTLVIMDVRQYKRGHNVTYTRCDEFGWVDPHEDPRNYTIALFVIQYMTPLIMMSFAYGRIFVFLWYYRMPGSQDMPFEIRQKVFNKQVRRRKMIKMLLAVILTFMVCHLPQHVMAFLWYVARNTFKAPPYMVFFGFTAEMMLYLNSALNPILYGFLHKKFHACAAAILRWIVCGDSRPNWELVGQSSHSKRPSRVSLTSLSKSLKKRSSNATSDYCPSPAIMQTENNALLY